MKWLEKRLTEPDWKDKCAGYPWNVHLVKDIDDLYYYKKLAMYEDLDNQKQLVRLPAPVGSKIWCLNGKFVLEYEIVGYSVDETGAWLIHLEHYEEKTKRTYSNSIDTEEIDKTAFLIKEDAEEKWQELISKGKEQ